MDPRYLLPPKEEEYRYSQHENSLENRGYVEYLTTFADHTIRRYVPVFGDSLANSPGDSTPHVLDFGSGPTPVFSELLKRWGYQVSIYDPFFAQNQQWDTQNYHAITSIEVFEHLTDPLGVLKKLSSLLLPGGYIFLRTQLHWDDQERFSTWWYPIDETHITFFHQETIEFLGEACNLKVISIEQGCEIVFQK